MTLLPAAVWHEGLQQQGASESVQRVFGPLKMEGPHLLLPLPVNYAWSQEGILLLRSLNGKELRGCGFQLLTTTFKACLHFSYGFQCTSLSNSP